MAVVVPVISTFDSRGIDRAIKDFRKLDGSANKMGYALRTADAAAAKIAKSVAKIGGVAALAGGFAAKAFIDFDDAMTQSLAIMGNVSDEMRVAMSDAARKMAKETTFSATQAAQSYFYLASAGLDAQQSVLALPKVAKFAQAGMFDMAQATDLLTDAQSALGMTIRGDAIANMRNMARVSDVLVKANTLANASVEQFSTSLTTRAAAAARVVGKDVEEVVSVLAAFADQGVKGEEAGTQFSIVLRDLQTRAIKNAGAFKNASIEVFDQSGKMQNLAKIVSQLEKRLSGMSDQQKKAELATLGFTDRSQGALLTLLGTSDAIARYEKELRNAGGTTDEVARKQLDSLKGQLTLARNALMDLAIGMGERLAPMVERIATVLRTFGDVIGEQGVGGGINYLSGSLFNAWKNAGALGKAAGVLVGAFIALRTASITFTATMTALNIVTTISNGALATLIARLGAAKIAMLAAGGVTALLTIAGTAYAMYAGQKAKAVDKTRDLVNALLAENAAQSDAFKEIAKNNQQFRIMVAAVGDVGLTMDDVNEFIQQGTGKFVKYVEALDKVPASAKKGIEQLDAYARAAGLTAGAISSAGGEIAFGLSELATIARNSRGEVIDMAKVTQLLTNAGVNFTNSNTGGGFDTMADKAEKAKQKFQEFKRTAESVFDQQKSLRSATRDTSKAFADLTNATKTVADAQEKLNRIAAGYGAGSQEAKDAQEALTLAQRDAERAGYNLEKANFAVVDAQKALDEARAEADPQKIREAEINLAEAKLSVKDAEDALTASTRAVNDAQTTLNETINGATSESQTYKDALTELRTAQDAEAEAVERVNEAKTREFEITKKLAEAELALAKIKKSLSAKQIKQARKVLADLGEMPSGLITTPPSQAMPSFDFSGINFGNLFDLNLGNIPMLAEGGIAIRPTLAMIGESGPEAVVPLRSGMQTGSTTINVMVQGGDPNAVVDALRRYVRQNGSLGLAI